MSGDKIDVEDLMDRLNSLDWEEGDQLRITKIGDAIRSNSKSTKRSFLNFTLSLTVGFLAVIVSTIVTGDRALNIFDPFNEVGDRLEKIEGKLKDFTSLHSEPGNAITYDVVGQKLISIESRMSKYEEAVGDDPIRAMSIPLLRKDIENLAAQDRALSSRISTIQNGGFGVLAFIAVLLTLNIFTGQRQAEKTITLSPEKSHEAD